MKKAKLIRPTAAEDAKINAGIAADPDTLEVSDEQFKEMRPFRRGRPPSDTHKVHVTLRLDPEVVEFFRAPGQGWQTRLNEALVGYVSRKRKAAK
jgi:uncharacterized protein (DUF4415 family)